MASVVGTNQPDIITTTTTPGATAASDQISGNNGGDHISGGDGDDQIHGDNGNDVLNGDAGNDRLFGDNGDDELNGGDGNDRIDGGRGDDVMTGGPGTDTFVLSPGNDRITDFSPMVTRSQLIGFDEFYPPQIPSGYKGLEWDGIQTSIVSLRSNSSGTLAVINSPPAVGTTENGSFSSPDDFDLQSGYFAAVTNRDLTLLRTPLIFR